MKLSLKQFSETIYGTYSHINDDDTIDEYILEGRIRNMYFVATAIPKSNRQIDAMSLLFHINHTDSKLIMDGSALAKNQEGKVEAVNSIEFKWIDS